MKAILYRTIAWEIELPDGEFETSDTDRLNPGEVCDYLDENDCWPNFLEGEELTGEIEVVVARED